jgi:hypothetical protein
VDVEVQITFDHDGEAGTPPIEYKEIFTFEMSEESLIVNGSAALYVTPDYEPGAIIMMYQSVFPDMFVLEEKTQFSVSRGTQFILSDSDNNLVTIHYESDGPS